MRQRVAIAVIVLGFMLAPTWAGAGKVQSVDTLTGHYSSWYGFAVEIPHGYGAFPEAVIGDHGVVIPLGTQGAEGPGSIEFYAAGNVLFWKTANDAVGQSLEWLRDRALGNVATVRAMKDTVVRGVRGVRVVAIYRDRDTRREMISDQIVMLRSRPGGNRLGDVPDIEYAFGVVSTAQQYEANRRLFERVLATVRFVKPQD